MLTLILVMSVGVEPQQTFVVTNKCGQRFSVTNKCQTVTSKVVQYVQLTVQQHSVGDGHTHTCANGHTWNHATNPTHNCQVCGLSQYVQDSTPRITNQQSYQPLTYSLQQSGGCANGQCQSYSPTQTQMSNNGWFLGKNLGRK